MTDKFLPGLILVFTLTLGVSIEAQENAAAASGMTSGLPGVSAAKQAELMYVRAQAQKARPEAEAAAMQRTAEQALDLKITSRTLDEARETKELKRQAAYDFQMKKAANAYKGVSQSEINAWGNSAGVAKVQQGVPEEFTASIPPEPEPEEEKGGRFKIFKGTSKAAAGAAGAAVGGMKSALSWRPFGKKKDNEIIEPPAPALTPVTSSPAPYYQQQPEAAPDPLAIQPLAIEPEEEKSKSGFLTKIPFIGGKKNKQDESTYVEPPAVQGDLGLASSEVQEKKGLFSKIPLIGRKKDKPVEEAAPMTSNNMTADEAFEAAAAAVQGGSSEKKSLLSKIPFVGRKKDKADAYIAAPEVTADTSIGAIEEEKKGFVGRMLGGGKKNSDTATLASSSSSGGNSTIDASLFPESGESDNDLMAKDLGDQKKKLLKMPSLSGVKVPKIKIPSPQSAGEKPAMPKVDRSGVHSGGSKTYVVQTANAQFMRFGNSALNSETMTLQSGQVVEMTKAGDEWSSVKLTNGTTGIMRNKDLRPAKAGEGASPGFATTGVR